MWSARLSHKMQLFNWRHSTTYSLCMTHVHRRTTSILHLVYKFTTCIFRATYRGNTTIQNTRILICLTDTFNLYYKVEKRQGCKMCLPFFVIYMTQIALVIVVIVCTCLLLFIKITIFLITYLISNIVYLHDYVLQIDSFTPIYLSLNTTFRHN